MAQNMYNKGMTVLLDGTCPFLTSTMKLIAVKSSYVFNKDHDFVDDLIEISGVSGYTNGYGGAGRKTLASKTITTDNAGDSAVIDAADVAFGALGAGDTIGGFAVIYETGGSDATAIPIMFFDVTDIPTNGSTITAQFDAAGMVVNTSP